jgi:quinoprotein dehydrogenase-associated probable ABC transporter substrate-binding protein
MYLHFLSVAVVSATLAAPTFSALQGGVYSQQTLRVCADPNNLPFSNDKQEGFENKLATLLSGALHETLTYEWWVERDNLVKNTLNANRCDVLLGVPVDFGDVLTTVPYYRSTYVFVYRRDRQLNLNSLYDPALQRLRIGMHVLGNGLAPPDELLAHQGIRSNVIGYSTRAAYGEPNPPAKLMDAVEKKEIDVAIVWGPLGGFFALNQPAPLVVTPVSPNHFGPVPFTFEIAMAVRNGNTQLRDRLNDALTNRAKEIRAILASYGIPQLEAAEKQ